MNDLYVDAEARGRGRRPGADRSRAPRSRASAARPASSGRPRPTTRPPSASTTRPAPRNRPGSSTGCRSTRRERRARPPIAPDDPAVAAALRRLHPRGRRPARADLSTSRPRSRPGRRPTWRRPPACCCSRRVDGDAGGARRRPPPRHRGRRDQEHVRRTGTPRHRPGPRAARRAGARSPASTAASAVRLDTSDYLSRRGRPLPRAPATARSPTTTATRKPISGSNALLDRRTNRSR